MLLFFSLCGKEGTRLLHLRPSPSSVNTGMPSGDHKLSFVPAFLPQDLCPRSVAFGNSCAFFEVCGLSLPPSFTKNVEFRALWFILFLSFFLFRLCDLSRTRRGWVQAYTPCSCWESGLQLSLYIFLYHFKIFWFWGFFVCVFVVFGFLLQECFSLVI